MASVASYQIRPRDSAALRRALSVYRDRPAAWRKLQKKIMQEDHSWEAAVDTMKDTYQETLVV